MPYQIGLTMYSGRLRSIIQNRQTLWIAKGFCFADKEIVFRLVPIMEEIAVAL